MAAKPRNTTAVPTDLPHGGTGLLVTCQCEFHTERTSAKMHPLTAGQKLTPDRIHMMVYNAHHPFLSRSTQLRQHGPWAV